MLNCIILGVEVLAVLQKIQVFWDVMLHDW